ncbi:hypothetical protein SKM54_04500 [Acinetobacter faecalis]|nr:hypothetical protein [Acinetobacter faecalis]MDY6481710.1 hypothetical protein [Acinetobacter faecalis]
MSVTMSGDGLASIFEAIETLTSQEVLVGIPHGEARSDSDMTNAQIGYIQETGSPSMNLPPRPFLVPGVESCQDQTAKHLTKAADAALKGNIAMVNRHLNTAGMIAQNTVRAYFTSGHFEPLSEVTKKMRLARGRKGINPLIDTGQLRRSVTYVIKKTGE